MNSPSRPPDSHIFFVDRSLGKHIVAMALRSTGVHVEVHDDYFSPDAADEHWLAEVGRKKWIVLTKDNRLRYHPRERAALLRHQVRAFILTARNLKGDEMARAFTTAIPKIERLLKTQTGACIVTISREGALRTVVP